jgi:hypothetical protein
MPGMEITYELTKQDFVEAYSAHRNRNAVSKWSRRLFIWIWGLMADLVFVGFLIKPSVQAAKGLAPFFGLVPMWIAILWLLPRWSIGRQFTKQPGASWAKNPSVGRIRSSLALGRRLERCGPWKNYIRTVEGTNQILFYTSPACFNLLPKRVIGPDQLAEVRSVLQENIQARK